MMAARPGFARLYLIVFMLRRSNTSRRLGDVNRWSGLRRCCRMVCKRRGGSGRLGRLRLIQELRHEATDLLKLQRAETGHRTWRIEIPRIFRQADEIADGGISCPGPAKRRACQLRRHIRRKQSFNVRIGFDRFDRRQRRRWRGLAGDRGNGFRNLGRARRRIPLRIRLRRHTAFSPRPAREERFTAAHSASRSGEPVAPEPRDRRGRAGASQSPVQRETER